MARSTYKVILFSRVKMDKQTLQWPTAVFNTHEDARAFATILGMAHRSGDVEAAKAMDTKTAVGEDGKLVPGVRFSILEAPYSPVADLGSSDMIDEPAAPTT